MQEIPIDSEFSDFCSLRAKAVIVTNSRPHRTCQIEKLEPVTEEASKENRYKGINSIKHIVRHLHGNSAINLNYPERDNKSLRIVSYSDSLLAFNVNNTSQVGYFISVDYKYNIFQPISFTSCHAKPVSGFGVENEVIAFADAFDMTCTMTYNLKAMCNNQILLTMYTDKMSLFDVLKKSKMTTENRLMIDLQYVKNAYNNLKLDDISDIKYVQKSLMP